MEQLFSQTGADVVLIRSFPNALDPNFAFFSGFSQLHYNSNLLLLEKTKKPTVFCSPLEFESAKKNTAVHAVLVTKKNLDNLLAKKIRNKTVGINFEFYPHQSWLSLKQKLKPKKIVDVGNVLAELRAQKTEKEIDKIKKACHASEAVLKMVPEIVNTGMTEKELAQKLHVLTLEQGCEELAFPTIVAYGKNAAIPHHVADKTKIQKNNFLLVDFGVKFENYCSDLSRTFFVGRPSQEQQWAYWKVWHAQQQAFEQVRPQVQARVPFGVADKILFLAFKQRLPHALGHGLGIKEHDFPSRLGPEEKWLLRPNQVLTLEPGVYMKRRFGIRIEDDIVVTQNGAEWLSKAPNELMRI